MPLTHTARPSPKHPPCDARKLPHDNFLPVLSRCTHILYCCKLGKQKKAKQIKGHGWVGGGGCGGRLYISRYAHMRTKSKNVVLTFSFESQETCCRVLFRQRRYASRCVCVCFAFIVLRFFFCLLLYHIWCVITHDKTPSR